MYKEEQEDATIYKIVPNHEEQFSICPAYWDKVGKDGLKDAGLTTSKSA
jgi:MbtH protein